MKRSMKGWKTKLGAVILALAPILSIFDLAHFQDFAATIGLSLMGAGIGHKIEKSNPYVID